MAKTIGTITAYDGDEHPYLRGHKSASSPCSRAPLRPTSIPTATAACSATTTRSNARGA